MGTREAITCRISLLVFTAGVAAASGGSLAGIATATAIGAFAGNLLPNLISDTASAFFGWLREQKATSGGPASNHDLDILTAQAIKRCLHDAEAASVGHQSIAGYCERLNKAKESDLLAVLRSPELREVGDDEALEMIGAADGGIHTETKTPDYWLRFVRALAKHTGADRDAKGVVERALGSVGELLRAEATPVRLDPHAEQAAAFLAGRIHRKIAGEANDVLRDTFGPEGRAYIAAQFLLLNHIKSGINATAKDVQGLHKRLDEFLLPIEKKVAAWPAEEQSSLRAALYANTEATRDNTAATRTNSEANDKNTAATRDAAAALELVAESNVDLTKAIGGLRNDLSAINGRPHSPPRLWHRNNFQVANLGTSTQRFVGRVAELDALATMVAAAPPGEAVVISAAPGVGKSTLAVWFGLTKAEAFDHVWYLSASEAAEERSLAALLTHLKEPIEHIKDVPGRTRLDALAERLRSVLCEPKPDGSPRRHLLILDNVETAATRNRYRLEGCDRVVMTTRSPALATAMERHMALGELDSASGRLLLTQKRTEWRTSEHEDVLNAIGVAVDRNAAALVYLSAVLGRPFTASPDTVLKNLRATEFGHKTHPTYGLRDHERPADYTQGVSEAFALFVEPFDEGPALSVLEAAALSEPDAIPLMWLLEGSGLDECSFLGAVEELTEAGVMTLAEDASKPLDRRASIHRLTRSLLRSRWSGPARARGEAIAIRLLRAGTSLFTGGDHDEITRKRTRVVPHLVAAADWVLQGIHATSSPQLASLALLSAAEHFLILGVHADAASSIQRSIACLETQNPRDEQNLAIRYATRARIRRDRGELVGAEEDIGRSISWGESQTPRDERGLAIDYSTRACIRRDRGNLAGAEQDIGRSIAWGESQTPRDEQSLANDYATRASIRKESGNLAGAEEDIGRSIAWLESQTPRDERGLASQYATRAIIHRARGDLLRSEEDINRSIAWGESQTPRNERSLAIWRATRAGIRHDSGDLAGAEDDIFRSIAWGESQNPRDTRGLAIRYATRAGIRHDRGDLAGAESDIRLSIELGELQTPRDERSLALRYATRAGLWRDRKRYSEALAEIERSLAWAEAQNPVVAWGKALWSGGRATVLAELHRLPEAIADITACIAWHINHQPDRRGRIAHFLSDQARIFAQSGMWTEAAASIADALPLHEAAFGTDHEWTKKARVWQAAIAKREVPPRWIDTPAQ